MVSEEESGGVARVVKEWDGAWGLGGGGEDDKSWRVENGAVAISVSSLNRSISFFFLSI